MPNSFSCAFEHGDVEKQERKFLLVKKISVGDHQVVSGDSKTHRATFKLVAQLPFPFALGDIRFMVT